MRRSITIGAAVVVAAALFTAVAVQGADAQPVKAAPKSTTRYYALAGSATHLLYSSASTSRVIVPITKGAHEYVLDAKHHRRAVPTGWSASLLGDRPLFTTTAKVDGVQSVRWKLPESHRSGSVPLSKGAGVIGAAPGGWVTSVKVGMNPDTLGPILRLTRVATNGRTTDLGVPYEDGAPYVSEVSDSGILASSYPGDNGDFRPDGTVKYMAWSKPGVWRTLYPAAGLGDANVYDIQCVLSSALATCSIEEPSKLLVLPLSPAKKPVVLTGAKHPCAQPGAALTSSTVWTDGSTGKGCSKGKVERYTLAGKLQRSTRTYSYFQQPVAAFGRLVVASKTQRTLLTISPKSVRSTPKHLIGG